MNQALIGDAAGPVGRILQEYEPRPRFAPQREVIKATGGAADDPWAIMKGPDDGGKTYYTGILGRDGVLRAVGRHATLEAAEKYISKLPEGT